MTEAVLGVADHIIDPLTAIIATASYGAVEMQQLRARAATGTVSATDVCSWLRDAELHFAEIADAGARINRLVSAQGARALEASAAPAPADATSGDAERIKRVLVIDNEPAILRVVQRMLRNHSVKCVTGASEALALLDAGAGYDIILCDVVMPGMTGLDLYEALLATHVEMARRLIFVTAGTDSAQTAELRRLEPARFIDKPFQAASLMNALERIAGPTAVATP